MLSKPKEVFGKRTIRRFHRFHRFEEEKNLLKSPVSWQSLALLRERSARITAVSTYRQLQYSAPSILLMGSERHGLSPEQQAICDYVASIPMVGGGDSLNLAIATGVMLYEIFHQQYE